MKERLETIKELVKKIEPIIYDEWRQQELTNLIESLYYADHINWLINRVEELEKVIGDLDENVAAFETLWLEEKRKNQRYKQALEFYADEETYETKFATDTDEICDPFTLIELDEGKKARKALEGDDD